jgi:Tol biopolymer transport system component
MGVVYKARDTRLNRPVALKLLPEEHARDEERLRRFTQEARSASALNHPNIVTIHDIGADGGNAYIVMEYVTGKTLDQSIPEKGMRLADVLKIGTQIADALGAAAAAGVVHRDIKPGNIMVTDSGLVKVLDFGLAKVAERASAAHDATATLLMADAAPRTREGAIVGTISYMSPEQAEGKPVDARSDIFSFGAVLYEMTTGQRAFRGQTGMSTIAAILRDDPTPPGEIVAGVPRDLEKIIGRCLRKDPERRFQSMAEVRLALLELKEEQESGIRAAPKAAPPRASRMPILIAAAAVVAVVALAAVYWLTHREAGPATDAQMRLVPFTSYRYAQLGPAFSPDGNTIAFAWAGEGSPVQTVRRLQIYAKLVGTDTPLRLTTSEADDIFPAWSPNGQSIAFVRYTGGGVLGIFQIGALGGKERSIATVLDAQSPRVSWSADSKFLVASGRETTGGPSRIFVISVETGEKRVLNLGGTAREYDSELSPDGHRLAFLRALSDTKVGLLVAELDGKLQLKGTAHELATPSGVPHHPTWTADSKDVLFTIFNYGTPPLWRMPADGSAPARLLPIAPEGADTPATSRKGNRLAFERRTGDTNVWQFPVETPSKVGAAVELIASTRPDRVRPGAWSPDGRKIAFESSRSGTMSVWIADRDGANATLLFGGSDYASGSPAWSPDGRWIALDSHKDGHTAVYVVPSGGGASRRLLATTRDFVVPSWSADGKWIYYSSDPTGRREIYKVPTEGGEPRQVTHNGGIGAMESADGKYLYYNRTEAGAVPLVRMPAEGGAETEVLPSVTSRSWVVTAGGIWFTALNGPATDVRYFDTRTGKTTAAVSITGPIIPGLSLSPDGRSLLYTQVDQQISEIQLVENFR